MLAKVPKNAAKVGMGPKMSFSMPACPYSTDSSIRSRFQSLLGSVTSKRGEQQEAARAAEAERTVGGGCTSRNPVDP
jgi:hypothetical protein